MKLAKILSSLMLCLGLLAAGLPMNAAPAPAAAREELPAAASAGGGAAAQTGITPVPAEQQLLISGLDPRLQAAALEVDRIIRVSAAEYVSLACLGLTPEEEALVEQAVVSTYAPESAPGYLFSSSSSGTRFVWPALARAAYGEHEALVSFAKAAAASLVKPGMTQAQIFRAIHTYVCRFLSYSIAGDIPTVLATGRGQCHFYALLTEAICREAGIPCACVCGSAKPRNSAVWSSHAWVQVCIGSTWYWSDPCWDDTGLTDAWLLSRTLWSDHRI